MGNGSWHFQGRAEANHTTLAEALERYENEITSHKKGRRSEKACGAAMA